MLHPDLEHIVDYRIWVDGLAPTRLARVARRKSDIVARNWDTYIPLEQAYLETCRPCRSAHLWVCGAELTAENTARSFSRLIDENGTAV